MSKDINLATIRITPSKRLWHLQLLFGCALAAASAFAIYPVIFNYGYWMVIEVTFLCLIFLLLVHYFKLLKRATFELKVYQNQLFVKQISGENVGSSVGEGFQSAQFKEAILVWPWIIVLPLELDSAQHKSLQLVVLSDSCGQDDWRRLRCYLLARNK